MFVYVHAHSFIIFHCLHDKALDLGEANPVYLVSLSWTLYYIKINKSGVKKNDLKPSSFFAAKAHCVCVFMHTE